MWQVNPILTAFTDKWEIASWQGGGSELRLINVSTWDNDMCNM